MTSTATINTRCPIRGHDHDVIELPSFYQRGSGDRARSFECPTGAYRWFVLDGQTLATAPRSKRPRYGWSAKRWTPLFATREEAISCPA